MNPGKGRIGSSRVIQRRWLSIKSGGELQCIGGEVHGDHRDYVVTKIPRFAFEKFPQAGACARPPFTLTTQMKSVGKAMAIGRTFKEGEHTRLACRFRRPRRNHIRPTSDSASEALDRSTRGRVRSPTRPFSPRCVRTPSIYFRYEKTIPSLVMVNVLPLILPVVMPAPSHCMVSSAPWRV